MSRHYIRPRLIDLAGNVLAGGWLNVLDAAGEDPVDVYAAEMGGSALEQPLTTDQRGEVELWVEISAGDLTLQWEDSGATVASANGRRVRFASFREFIAAPSSSGGAGLHSELPDLEDSGHPASIISYDGTVLAGIGVGGVSTVQDLDLAWAGLGGAIGSAFEAIGNEETARIDADAAEATARADGDATNATAAAAAQSDADAAGTAAAAAQATADGAIPDPGGADGTFLSRVSGVWSPVPNPGGGGGGAGGGEAPMIHTGWWAAPLFDPQLSGGFSLTPGRSVFAPFPVRVEHAIDRIGVTIPYFGPQADVVLRLGIWADDDGYPGDLIIDAGTIDASTSGTIDTKQLVIAETLTAGLVWLSASYQGAGSGTVWVLGGNITGSSLPAPSAGYLGIARAAWRVDDIAGALPGTAPDFSDIYSAVPAIAVRGA